MEVSYWKHLLNNQSVRYRARGLPQSPKSQPVASKVKINRCRSIGPLPSCERNPPSLSRQERKYETSTSSFIHRERRGAVCPVRAAAAAGHSLCSTGRRRHRVSASYAREAAYFPVIPTPQLSCRRQIHSNPLYPAAAAYIFLSSV